jgi:23S rRNA pseudouridine1911/1915/1917 synthase
MTAGSRIEGTIEQAGRLDKAVSLAAGISRERVKKLVLARAATVNGAPVDDPAFATAAGDRFALTLPRPEPGPAAAQELPLAIVHEDDELIVVDKPAGMVVHPAAGNREGTLVNALLHHCRGRLSGINGIERPGIVHRIDKDTSGLIVVAKTDRAHTGLAAQFAEHTVHRRYLAVCAGHPRPPELTVEGLIGRSDRNRKKMAVLPANGRRGKHAITHIRTVRPLEGCALIECRLETGRTHQIRVHCSSIGHPLLGDPLYGRVPNPLRGILVELGFARQALHAAELGFTHPASGEEVRFSSGLPADMAELIGKTAR